jgi:hypothetical protein
VNKVKQKWRLTRQENISISRNLNTDIMLFADDQILQAESEDNLQYSVYNLTNIAAEFSMEMNKERN